MNAQKEVPFTGSKLRTRDQAAKPFGAVLGEYRRRRGYSQEVLAERLGVSRGYLSLLESTDERAAKSPSLRLLARICQTLVIGNSVEFTYRHLSELNTLCFSALGLPVADLYQRLVGDSKDEVDHQCESWVSSVWIVSPVLGENQRPEFLEATIKNLRRGVRYTYFVPEREEWIQCLKKLSEYFGTADDLAEFHQVVAIKSPPLMCLPRIRILNPGEVNAEGSVTLGPMGKLEVHQLEPEQVAEVFRRLSPVVIALSSKGSTESPDGDFSRLFPLGGMQ